MILTYLAMAVTTPAGYVLIPWTLVALFASSRGAKWFGWFFAISAALFVIGSIALADYASDPAVDSDGTTLFSAAMLMGVFVVYGFAIFILCAVVTIARNFNVDRRSNDLESY